MAASASALQGCAADVSTKEGRSGLMTKASQAAGNRQCASRRPTENGSLCDDVGQGGLWVQV